MLLRRLLFWVPTIAITSASAVLAASQMTAAGGFDAVDALLLLLLTVSSGYVASQSWQVVLGLFWRPSEQPVLDRTATPGDFARLAVVMPICDEDVASVFGAVEIMRRSMAAAGLGASEVFVLSDTRNAAVAQAEELAFTDARARSVPALPPVHYRRRLVNARRKVGNIAEFCDEHGARFELMLVLDADSLMSGDAIRGMAERMFASPRLGLVQTLCFPARRTTLFARIQQFGARLYAPLHTRGMALWTGADGVYWGHNAMIRVAPFREHCRLPVLPGAPPLGGEILCHDVVEAAFLRRAGWDVLILPDVAGTWEDMPSNTLDFAARDRRWCQGNLQHMGLLREKGLTAGMLYHFANGILAYASAPIWLCFLLAGTLQYAFADTVNDTQASILAPAVAAPILFWLSLAVIFLPKLLSIAFALADARQRRAFGGGWRLCASAVAETLFGLLWSQMSIVFYSRFVVATLCGSSVAWDPQARGDRGVSWGEAWLRHRWHVALAVVWGTVVWQLDRTIFYWMSPFFLGLAVSPLITVWTSRAGIGLAARRLGLFLTEDETDPKPELAALPAEIERVAAVVVRTAPAETTHAKGALLPPRIDVSITAPDLRTEAG